MQEEIFTPLFICALQRDTLGISQVDTATWIMYRLRMIFNIISQNGSFKIKQFFAMCIMLRRSLSFELVRLETKSTRKTGRIQERNHGLQSTYTARLLD